MADDTKAPADKKPKRPSLDSLIKQLHGIHDHAARKAFYKANPELRAMYSEVNFH